MIFIGPPRSRDDVLTNGTRVRRVAA